MSNIDLRVNPVNLRLELDFAAQRMIQLVQVHNEELNKQAEAAVNRAISELLADNRLESMVMASVKTNIENLIQKDILGYEAREKIKKAVQDKIYAKLDAFADALAEKVIKSIEP